MRKINFLTVLFTVLLSISSVNTYSKNYKETNVCSCCDSKCTEEGCCKDGNCTGQKNSDCCTADCTNQKCIECCRSEKCGDVNGSGSSGKNSVTESFETSEVKEDEKNSSEYTGSNCCK